LSPVIWLWPILNPYNPSVWILLFGSRVISTPLTVKIYSRWNYDVGVEFPQEFKLAYGSEVEDWRRVGNNDQAPAGLLAR
jgi:hypothetical protein